MLLFNNNFIKKIINYYLTLCFIVSLIICSTSCDTRVETGVIHYENQLGKYLINGTQHFYLENYLYRIINNNVPNFKLKEYDGQSFEKNSELDELGRCGPAEAFIGEDIMPSKDDKRGSIGMIKPSGWPTPQKKYDSVEK